MKKYTAKVTAKTIEQNLPSDYRKAIAGFIWNGFDAGATEVRLDFQGNEVGHLSGFSISDNGTGINAREVDSAFGNFMDSKKLDPSNLDQYRKNRKGKGRYGFSVFADNCTWSTAFLEADGKMLKYTILIDKGDLQNFSVEDTKIVKGSKTGTTVDFLNIFGLYSNSLSAKDFEDYLCGEFGWYMFKYRELGCKILINGQDLDYQQMIGDSEKLTYEIGGEKFHTVFIRWNHKIGDKYFFYFMDQGHEEVGKRHTSFNNKAIDFHHSVYVESPFFDNFHETIDDNPVLFSENNQSHPSFKDLLKALNLLILEKEKHYIRDVQADNLINDFKTKGVFPGENIRSEDLEAVLKEIYCAEPRIFQSSNIQQSKTLLGFLNLLLITHQNEHILEVIESVTELTEEERENLRRVL
jgi:hypothetical protein